MRRSISNLLLLLGLLTVGAVTPLRAQSADAQAPLDWRLSTLAGEEVSLARFRGQVVFINYWATWCKPCVAELASIQRLQQALAGERIVFLLVSPERPGTVARFLRRHRYTLPAYRELQRPPPAFGFRALPTTWVLDAQGRLVLTHRGAARWDSPRTVDALRHLSRSTPLPPATPR